VLRRAPHRHPAPPAGGNHPHPKPLTAGTDATALDQALLTLAGQCAPATSPGLAPTTSLGFLALTPTGPAPQINALAAACTRDLDRFRSPPTQAELTQRRTRLLSARQDANLTRWGYPYVLDDYRFHLTLTGRLQPGEAEALIKAATTLAAPHLDPVQHLDEICLFGDPGGGNGFRLLRRYPLMG
jgi:hypothetical protein